MNTSGELDDLAHKYLDLWQDQVSALAEDPEVVRALSRVCGLYCPDSSGASGSDDGATLAALWQHGAASGWSAFMAAWAGSISAVLGDIREQRGDDGGAYGGETHGTAAAPGSSGNGAGDVDELLRRIADLEERIASLESERAPPHDPERGTAPASGGGAD